MSPSNKRFVLFSILGLIFLGFFYFPTFYYAVLLLALSCFAYYYAREPLPARLGRNPRRRLNLGAWLSRWLPVRRRTGIPIGIRRRSACSRAELQEAEGNLRRVQVFRREPFVSTPRDFLMGSYLTKLESPNTDSWRPQAGRNPREQLLDRLSRPNHAVNTPNKRLSFAGETPGSVTRFSITPKRHYPLQQPAVSPVGLLSPYKWDFRKKSVPTPQKSGAFNPFTLRIPSRERFYSPAPIQAPPDPCARENVIKALKESRKRVVADEDKALTAEQQNKRRRNDSSESTHSAFGSLLLNGTPSPLVPQPGNLKRGMTSSNEDLASKRPRASSSNSNTGQSTSKQNSTTTNRNAILSSYSSSVGLQPRTASPASSLLSTPVSSRPQTPEVAFKKPREEDVPSSSSTSNLDQSPADQASVTTKPTSVPKMPVTVTEPLVSGGSRKRKIQLVSTNRSDDLSLPPPLELGHTVTSKDLDEEKMAAINTIQKILGSPEPEQPEQTVPSAVTMSSQVVISTTNPSSTPLPTPSSFVTPVKNLDTSSDNCISTRPAESNSLLAGLKLKTSETSSPSALVSTTKVTTMSTAPELSNSVSPNISPSVLPTGTASKSQSSAFLQVLGQVFKSPSSITSPSVSTSSFAVPVTAPSSSTSAGISSSKLTAGFKPIFPGTTTTSSVTSSENKPSVQSFKPIFGDVPAFTQPPPPTDTSTAITQPPPPTDTSTAITQPPPPTDTSTAITQPLPPANTSTTIAQPPPPTNTSTASTLSSSTSSLFGATTSSTTTISSGFPGFSSTEASTVSTLQPAALSAAKSLFGNWSAPSTTGSSSAPSQPPTAAETFHFSTAAITTAVCAPAAVPATSGQSAFTFGATQPNLPGFSFSTGGQNTTTASIGSTAPTPTQHNFAFKKSTSDATTADLAFGSSAGPPKPFTFGGSGTSSTPASNPAPASYSFAFGATPAATTTAGAFGNPSKPPFGASSTGFGFSAGASSSAAPSAQPSFGASTQSQSSFAFGGAPQQQIPAGSAQPSSGVGFSFGASMPPPQFGTPVSNNPPQQMGSFNFGGGPGDKPAFGTSTPFGQGTPRGPTPFGTPGTSAQAFNATPFGPSTTPTFSIGAGSKPSGARQRLQARRQHHNRKK